jgi:hypothetical protein
LYFSEEFVWFIIIQYLKQIIASSQNFKAKITLFVEYAGYHKAKADYNGCVYTLHKKLLSFLLSAYPGIYADDKQFLV